MLFSRSQVRGGLYLYRDEDDDDQGVISINLMPHLEWELKHLQSHLCQKSQSCTSAVFDNLI